MQCPKCGSENPDNAQLCSVCACVLKNHSAESNKAYPRTDRLAVISLVLSIFGLFTFLITSALSIALAITSLVRISRRTPELKGRWLAVTAIVISALTLLIFVGVVVLWTVDADPIPNDYTVADLRSAPPECSASYELLSTLVEEQEEPSGAPAIGLSAQDVNTIEKLRKVIREADYAEITQALEENSDNINLAWENAKRGRNVISELDTFPEIADLTEPDIDAEMGFLRSFRHLACLYDVYVCLQSRQTDNQTAVDELIQVDSVFRKLSVNARSTVTKLVCFAYLNMGITTANFIVNNPRTSRQTLELLAEHFTPLAAEQMSLRNSNICEYLMEKNILDTQLGTCRKSPVLKYNSTLRLCRNRCDRWIALEQKSQEISTAMLSVWPSGYPMPQVSLDSNCRLPWFYEGYNPMGSLVATILVPAMEKVFEIKTKLQIEDDLFQIVLAKKLGGQSSLKARAYSHEYIIDMDNKKIFSPGPDGEPDTCDDIKLPINPQTFELSLP